MPEDSGSTRPRTSCTAIAASTAEPPRSRIPCPACTASGCAAALIVGASTAQAQTVQLIKPEEAKLPAAAAQPPRRAIARGPGIKLSSAESVAGQFPFKVVFEPRGGSTIDPASVKVEYLKDP